jgi:predicted nucleic acid-binding protein
MILTLATRLFFDASCLFPAAASPAGGSAFLVSVCARGYLQAVVSLDVLIEAERNIVEKLSPDAFHRYRQMVAETPFVMLPSPPEEAVARHAANFFEDAHVVASAVAGGCEFLITLDRRLQRRVEHAALGITALSPGEFIQTVLPEHPEYARVSGVD